MAQIPHYFIGFKMTQEIASWLHQIQTNLRHLPYQTWTALDDYHITLKFLGAVDNTLFNRIDQDLQRADLGSPFSLSVGSLGFFGSRNRPRVMWVGTSDESGALSHVYENVESIALRHNFSRENRPFHPHITLAKKWTGSDIDSAQIKDLQAHYNVYKHMTVNSIGLYRVNPGQSPKYIRERSYRLIGDVQDGPTC